MARTSQRLSSQYARDAASLLGQLIREGRIARHMSVADLAVRAGVSRDLVYRIERGDLRCAIGVVFETAAICGVPLFEPEERSLAMRLARHGEKLALLPKAVRPARSGARDDF